MVSICIKILTQTFRHNDLDQYGNISSHAIIIITLSHINLGIHVYQINPQTNSGIPKPKRGSPHLYTKTGIPKVKWGCASNESPQTNSGIPKPKRGSPNPQTKMGIPKAKWESASQRIAKTNPGIPKPIWGSPNRNGYPFWFGDCSVTNQNRFGVRSNLGTMGTCPQFGMGLKTGTPFRNGDP